MSYKSIILGLLLAVSAAAAHQDASARLGKLENGQVVSFVVSEAGQWGIEIKGGNAPSVSQPHPVMLEVYLNDGDIRRIACGYDAIGSEEIQVAGTSVVRVGQDIELRVSDCWKIVKNVLSVKREIEITGNSEGGFYSSIILDLNSVEWDKVDFFAPGTIYGDPTFNGRFAVGGTINHQAKNFRFREDILEAPLLGMLLENGHSLSVLNPAPKGDTILADSNAADVLIDARLKFGAIGAWQSSDKPIQLGFCYPGTANSTSRRMGPAAGTGLSRRLHPITQGVEHSYQVSFRFGEDEDFPKLTRNAWRWAWDNINPQVNYHDIELVRTTLINHLASTANTIKGRTGIPFALSTQSEELQWNYTMTSMGFVAKNIECADQLLRQADRDNTEQSKQMRRTGLSIISSMITALKDIPLVGDGYDLATGKQWTGDHPEWVAPWLRNATEDMRVLMNTYRREKLQGKLHPEWIEWVKSYSDWLLTQQRPDGSFPRRWKPGTSEVEEESGTSSYSPVPMLVILSEETGNPEYKKAAIRAADYVWNNWGRKGLFIGGTIDNPNITDKEAGMLSLEAFLSLYESTQNEKWLERALVAADFTESWIWIWNTPMPLDAKDANLHWKKGIPALGFQGIATAHAGSVDQYLDWSVPTYAKLYKITGDKHYLDVAKILLHNTKAMVALPNRLYDMQAPGYQQEGWRMGPGSGRGLGGHRFWLPWISANHLYGITGLEEYDAELYKQLITK